MFGARKFHFLKYQKHFKGSLFSIAELGKFRFLKYKKKFGIFVSQNIRTVFFEKT